jgi:tetratricopeptide (TPR) repeat protein
MAIKTKRFQPFQSGDGNINRLLDFAWSAAQQLDPTFDPPRESISKDEPESQQDVMKYVERWGHDTQGFDTLHQVELEPRASGQAVDKIVVTAFGLASGSSLELEVTRSWYDPRFAEIRINGPKAEVKQILAQFETAFGATKLDPSRIRIELVSAEVSFKVGAYDAAIQKAESVLKVSPDEALAHFVIGASSLAKGQDDDAQEHLSRAYELDPEHQLTLSNFARLQERLGNAKDAQRLYERILAAPVDSSLRPEFYEVIRESMNKLNTSSTN